ncbi:MAG: DUF5309 domain-containing protein [Aestuariivirga sp.]|nr:DUF5309 domain-containing protein [Aestuariivirga sp.]
MAQPEDTFDAFDMVGIKEDLEDIIYDISPTATPFMTAAGRVKCKQVLHEWQTDVLGAASATNHVIEGDDATTNAQVATMRVSNRCNISDKVILVSGTSRAVDSAGRGDELDYLIAKNGKELKRDMESLLTSNNASVTGNSTTARELGGFESWIETNESRGAGGSDGGFSSGNTVAATDGTQRAFTETLLKEVIRECFNAGAEPTTVMVGAFNKQVMSTFTGNATRQNDSKSEKLFAAIDIYKSDFGTLKVVPNRFSRSRSALVLDPEYMKVGYLRPFSTHKLAKTGDSDRVQLLAEYTLVVGNEAGHGVIADLTDS